MGVDKRTGERHEGLALQAPGDRATTVVGKRLPEGYGKARRGD